MAAVAGPATRLAFSPLIMGVARACGADLDASVLAFSGWDMVALTSLDEQLRPIEQLMVAGTDPESVLPLVPGALLRDQVLGTSFRDLRMLYSEYNQRYLALVAYRSSDRGASPRLGAGMRVPRAQVVGVTDLAEAGRAGRLVNADLRGVALDHADLSGADLQGAKLARATLGRVDLTGANLSGADLSGAMMSRARLHGAKILEATAMRTVLARALVVDADLTRTDLSGAQCRGADFTGSRMSWVKLVDADLSSAVFDLVVGSGMDFSGARAPDISAREADLQGSGFRETVLAGGDFTGANLGRAILAKADLRRANLGEADVSGADLDEANLALAMCKLVNWDEWTRWPERFRPPSRNRGDRESPGRA